MSGIIYLSPLQSYDRVMETLGDKNICCREFHPSRWDEKTHVWKNKLFLRGDVVQIMHIPVNISAVIKKMFAQIESAHALPETKDFLMLSYDPSPWKSELYMTVTKEIPDGETVQLSGTYISKVFDGPYHHVPKWIKDMEGYLAEKKQKSLKYYFHFAYCPKCMKKYGHNYCVAFAQVK